MEKLYSSNFITHFGLSFVFLSQTAFNCCKLQFSSFGCFDKIFPFWFEAVQSKKMKLYVSNLQVADKMSQVNNKSNNLIMSTKSRKGKRIAEIEIETKKSKCIAVHNYIIY